MKIEQTKPNSVVLEEAAALLEKGWFKGWWEESYDEEGNKAANAKMCVESALMFALGIEEVIPDNFRYKAMADNYRNSGSEPMSPLEFLAWDDGDILGELSQDFYNVCPVYTALEEHLSGWFKDQYSAERENFLRYHSNNEAYLPPHLKSWEAYSNDSEKVRAMFWNDADGTTQEEVVRTLRSAAEIERYKESKTDMKESM